MSVLDVDAGAAPAFQAAAVEGDETYSKSKLGFWFWASCVWLVLLVFSAFFASFLPLKDPTTAFAGVSRSGPSAAHWFGTDNIGHDIFSRTIYGARRSLFVSFLATVFGLTFGTTTGLIAGFYRRGLDSAVNAVLNILLAIPGLVLLLSVIAFLAPPGKASPDSQTFWATIALAVLTVPIFARVTRAQTMAWGDRDFVMASRTLGTRNKRIMFHEILPNVVPTLVSFAFTVGAALIILEAALAFFGIGDVSGVSWGLMIQNGRSQLEDSPQMVLFPAVFMTLTILALNFIGDAVLTRFAVREGGI